MYCPDPGERQVRLRRGGRSTHQDWNNWYRLDCREWSIHNCISWIRNSRECKLIFNSLLTCWFHSLFNWVYLTTFELYNHDTDTDNDDKVMVKFPLFLYKMASWKCNSSEQYIFLQLVLVYIDLLYITRWWKIIDGASPLCTVVLVKWNSRYSFWNP